MQEFIEDMKRPISEIAYKAISAYMVMILDWLVIVETVSKLGNYQEKRQLTSAIQSSHNCMGKAMKNFIEANYVTKEIAYDFIFGLSDAHSYVIEINNHAKNLDEIVEDGNLHEPELSQLLHDMIAQMAELVAQ